MLCWICNENEADSGEHKFKSSLLREMHGSPFPKGILIGNTNNNKILEGANNKKVKFPKVICHNCNTTITSPHDKSFDTFINWAYNNYNQLRDEKFINFQLIFGDDWLIQKMNLYKYVAKHAGCKIISGDITNNLDNLSDLIYKNIHTPTFKLKFILKEGFHHLNILLKVKYEERVKFMSNSSTIGYFTNDQVLVYFGGMTTYNWMSIAWVYTQNNFKTLACDFSNQKEPLMLFPFDELPENNGEFDWYELIDNQRMTTEKEEIDFYNEW